MKSNRKSNEIVNQLDSTVRLPGVLCPAEQNLAVPAAPRSGSWCQFEVRVTLIKPDCLLASSSPLMRRTLHLLIDICRSGRAASGKMELSLRVSVLNRKTNL